MTAGAKMIDFDPEDQAAHRRTGILPPEAAEIFRRISDDAEDAGDLAGAAHQRSVDDKHEVFRIAAQIEEFKRDPKWNDRDPAYLALLRGQERARKERAQGQQKTERKSEAARTLVAIRSNIDSWLGSNHDRIIIPHAHPAPKLGKGESPADAVNRCRQAQRDIRGERTKVGNAPISAADAKAAIRAFVAQTAALARPEVSAVLAGSPEPYFPNLSEAVVQPLMSTDYAILVSGGRVRDGLALACWLTPDAVIAALDREIDATADDKRAMTADAKAARLAELDDALLKAERDEVAFIHMVEDQGGTLNHRPDIDPRAILQVEVADADGVLTL